MNSVKWINLPFEIRDNIEWCCQRNSFKDKYILNNILKKMQWKDEQKKGRKKLARPTLSILRTRCPSRLSSCSADYFAVEAQLGQSNG